MASTPAAEALITAAVQNPKDTAPLNAIVSHFSKQDCSPLSDPHFLEVVTDIFHMNCPSGEPYDTQKIWETNQHSTEHFTAIVQCMWLASRILESRLFFGSHNVIAPLCTLLRGSEGMPHTLLDAVIRLVTNLGSNETEAHQPLFAAEGAPAALVGIMRRELNNETLLEPLLYAVQNLSTNTRCVDDFLSCGLAPLLEAVCRTHIDHAPVLAALCGVVSNMCWDNADARAVLGAAGLIQAMVDIVKVHLERGTLDRALVSHLFEACEVCSTGVRLGAPLISFDITILLALAIICHTPAQRIRLDIEANEEAFARCAGLIVFFNAITALKKEGEAADARSSEGEELGATGEEKKNVADEDAKGAAKEKEQNVADEKSTTEKIDEAHTQKTGRDVVGDAEPPAPSGDKTV